MTLEMRVFARRALLADLRAAGFGYVRVVRSGSREHGVYWPHPWSLPILASPRGPSRAARRSRAPVPRAVEDRLDDLGKPSSDGSESASDASMGPAAVRVVDRDRGPHLPQPEPPLPQVGPTNQLGPGRSERSAGALAAARPSWWAVAWLRARGTLRTLIARRRWNPLFDGAWYQETYPDVTASGMDPYRHYRRHGAREGRDPSPFIDCDWYLATYPDVAGVGMDPIDHYVLLRRAGGTSILPELPLDLLPATASRCPAKRHEPPAFTTSSMASARAAGCATMWHGSGARPHASRALRGAGGRRH